MNLPKNPTNEEYLAAVQEYLGQFGDAQTTVAEWALQPIHVSCAASFQNHQNTVAALLKEVSVSREVMGPELASKLYDVTMKSYCDLACYMFIVGALAERMGWDTGVYVVGG